MKHHAPVGQVHEDHPALKGDNGVEGVAHRRFGGDAATAVNGEVRVMPITCSLKRASRQQLSTGVAVLWRERGGSDGSESFPEVWCLPWTCAR
jgi:hypothetical protein